MVKAAVPRRRPATLEGNERQFNNSGALPMASPTTSNGGRSDLAR